MKRQSVESREYKVMLRNDLFKGDAANVVSRANDLFGELATAVARLTPATDGRFEDDGKTRRVTFWDTPKQHLNEAGYICRHREKLANGDREVTLKFRHRDRYVSQDRDMSAARADKAKTKFEEDIKKPFISLYSFSTTIRVDEERPFKRLGDVSKVFPGLEDGIQHDKDEKVVLVNDFTARELVLKGATIRLARTPKVDAECALVVWYPGARESAQPVAVELSFRYGDKDELYDGKVAARAYDVFGVIQRDLDSWLNTTDLTKTALVYGKGEGV